MEKALSVFGAVLGSALLVASFTAAQEGEWQDAVHLKNGSVLRGVIVERVPGEGVKIRTAGGNVFAFRQDEIARETREPAPRPFPGHFGPPPPGGPLPAPAKNPSNALVLSLVVPGAGQHYNGQSVKGVLQEALFLTGCAVAFIWGVDEYESLSEFNNGEFSGSYSGEVNDWYFVGCGLIATTYVWSVVDAPLSALKINRRPPSPPHARGLSGERYAFSFGPGAVRNGLGFAGTLSF